MLEIDVEKLLKTSDYMSIRNRLMKPVLELRG